MMPDKEKKRNHFPQHATYRISPRLAPVEQPKGLILKGAYKLVRMKTGKVITPFKVIQARFPESIPLSRSIVNLEQKLTLDQTLKYLIKCYIAAINNCSFCVDIAKASAMKEGVNAEKFKYLLTFEENSLYNKGEKTALKYVEEATREKHVSDETFNRLKSRFTEREIIEITWLCAIENYYNLMNGPLNIPSDELCSLTS